MDGSIADSTVLRMRSQLQRMHPAAPSNGANGFLEELLKLPTAPVTTQIEDDEPFEQPLDGFPLTAAVGPSEETSKTDEDPSESEEPVEESAPLPCVPVCYAPVAIDQPQTAAPVAEGEADIVEANGVAVESPAVPIAAVEAQFSQTVASEGHIETPDGAETEAIDSELAISDAVQPVQSNIESVTQDSLAVPVRDLRRPKASREKVEATSERPIDASKSAATLPVQSTSTSSGEKTLAQEDHQNPTQPADEIVQPPAERPSETKSDRDDGRSDRDKWYENELSGGSESGQSSLVDRIQEKLNDQDAGQGEANIESMSAQSAFELTDTAVDASAVLTEVPLQVVGESSLMASDMTAAAQANIAQGMKMQSVTESAMAASVDASGRGNQTPTSSVGPSGVPRSGTASNSLTATSSSDTTDKPREITQQERVRLVQRVARSFSRLGPDGGQVTLKLHPPQLGVLNVSIKMDGQTMTARLQTETSAARDAIIENLSLLRDRLSEQGIEIEKFQVEVGQQEDMSGGNGQSSGFSGNGANSQQSESTSTDYDYRRAARNHASRRSPASPPMIEPRLQGWPTADRSLDIRA